MRFFEPPRVTEIGLKNPAVRENGGKITVFGGLREGKRLLVRVIGGYEKSRDWTVKYTLVAFYSSFVISKCPKQ